MTGPLCVVALYKQPTSTEHGEAPFWSWDQWGPTYVKRFWRGISRALGDIPWFGTLVTDTPTIWAPCCEDAKLPISLIPLIGDSTGWWAKVEVFRPEVSEGLTLYCDLDTVFGGSIAELVDHNGPLTMLRDPLYPTTPNGGIMLFQADEPTLRGLWTEYVANPRAVEREFAGDWPNQSDQAFIRNRVEYFMGIPRFQDHLPASYICSENTERDLITDDTRIVFSSYLPKPHTDDHPWIKRNWI